MCHKVHGILSYFHHTVNTAVVDRQGRGRKGDEENKAKLKCQVRLTSAFCTIFSAVLNIISLVCTVIDQFINVNFILIGPAR